VLQTQFFPQYFWQGEGTPQEEVNNRTFRWTGGRLLGGGSSVNRQLYVRPTPAVLRRWENLLGPLWSPEEATKILKELERYNGTTDNPEARGFRGRLDVRQAPINPSAMARKIVLAIEQATGFREILDYNNSNTPIGPFIRNQYTQMPNGMRESSSTAFLSPDVLDREGFGVNGRRLRLLTEATVLQILFYDRRATGVKFLLEGHCCIANARKRIVVCSGFKSPKLLMLSGIGPAEDLRAAGIPVIYNNPNVGRHLANHTIIAANFSTNPNDPPVSPEDPNAHLIAGAFLPSPVIGTNPRLREIQIEPFVSNGVLVVGISPVQPRSRGRVIIQSDDPLKIELGDEEFLDNPADMQLLKDTFRIYIKNIAAKLSAIDPNYKLLSPTVDIIDNDARLDSFIRQNLNLTFHEMSTLRMARSAAEGVTNFRGEVFGVRNLVVADNSIVPFVVDGNTQAIAYVIGLTVARQILEQDRCNS
jgi:choline dehydrogenase